MLQCRLLKSSTVSKYLVPMRLWQGMLSIPNRRLDSAKSRRIKMQKSGIKFWELMPRTIVPLDSAFVNLVYTAYFSAFDGFLQVIKLWKKEHIKLDCHANWRLLAMTMQCCKATKKRKKTTPPPEGNVLMFLMFKRKKCSEHNGPRPASGWRRCVRFIPWSTVIPA